MQYRVDVRAAGRSRCVRGARVRDCDLGLRCQRSLLIGRSAWPASVQWKGRVAIHLIRDEGVAGSNPATPISLSCISNDLRGLIWSTIAGSGCSLHTLWPGGVVPRTAPIWRQRQPRGVTTQRTAQRRGDGQSRHCSYAYSACRRPCPPGQLSYASYRTVIT